MTKSTLDITNTAISGGIFEPVRRYGDAGAEFLKGLRVLMRKLVKNLTEVYWILTITK